jgi:hypothetical protein
VEGVGAWLARQRQIRGVDLEELARRTRIPRRSLERLEAGAFDGQRDGFARGFVRSVAAALGLDADDAVGRLLPEAGVRERAASPPLRRVLLVLVGLGAAAALGTASVRLASRLLATTSAPEPVQASGVRRDAVRALAVAEGLLPAEADPTARPLEPVPAGPPEPPAAAAPRGAGPSAAAPPRGAGPSAAAPVAPAE